MSVTPTMKRALKELDEHGGSGVITKTGTVLAAGEILGERGCGQLIAYASATWLRLAALELIEGDNGRLRITAAGSSLLQRGG